MNFTYDQATNSFNKIVFVVFNFLPQIGEERKMLHEVRGTSACNGRDEAETIKLRGVNFLYELVVPAGGAEKFVSA